VVKSVGVIGIFDKLCLTSMCANTLLLRKQLKMHENTTSIKIDMSKNLIYFSDSFPVEGKTLSQYVNYLKLFS